MPMNEGSGAMGGNLKRNWRAKMGEAKSGHGRVRENQYKNKSEELALAVSIILANLSCDEEFLSILLGVEKGENAGWKPVKQPEKDLSDIEDLVVDQHGQVASVQEIEEEKNNRQGFELSTELKRPNNFTKVSQYKRGVQETVYGSYDDEQLKNLPEVERITRLFNLLSHDNIYISE